MVLTALEEIPGIEDPELLSPDAPNFFADAWRERHWLLGARKGDDDAPDGFALGLNSEYVRSQDRLHVHMACLRPDVQRALAPRVLAVNPNRFARLNFRLGGRPVWAMRIDAANTIDFNPIEVLHDNLPVARAKMGSHTLIAVRERLPDGRPTIILLTNLPQGSAGGRFPVELLLRSRCD